MFQTMIYIRWGLLLNPVTVVGVGVILVFIAHYTSFKKEKTTLR